MALRIHFTADDLARTTVAVGPDIMWELVNSLHVLQSRRAASEYAPWLRHVRDRFTRRDLRGPVRLLTALVPPKGGFPDFLTPPGGDSIGTSLDLIRATPAARLRTELDRHFGPRTPPPWFRRLAEGDRAARQELDNAVGTYFRELLAPQLSLINDSVHTDRAHYSRDVLDGGTERLLNTVSPSITWEYPTLTADYPRDRDLHLRGRGISLVPSFFCTSRPVTLIDPGLPPVLVHPAARHPGPLDTPASLPELLGRTRAMALSALTTPCSTGELALRIGVSIGTASKHASVLRGTGLITSTRRGHTVLHALTPLGRELLGGRRR
ncbi:ArsR/SmtB family transcription factor [Streptomyces lomondensis]|uniref:Transcriptional regulator n=1 Tax=Streptomyces lomondensis TaxID=68229 RepID=A0ABQ2X007_9ACTN|nr:winged helix-turn-helix domain-containing protein [Streptomyces lomondensis]MCF0076161.1 winged helix-turn-helix domain-containing protein [Streptomyces lomondensis]GGW88544.1 transcriptional regulator [Streptomyces lomondensis]